MPIAKKYLPDDINLKSVTRELLFTVSNINNIQIFSHISPEKYVKIYDSYKAKLTSREYNKIESIIKLKSRKILLKKFLDTFHRRRKINYI